jgi:hypothetical protein
LRRLAKLTSVIAKHNDLAVSDSFSSTTTRVCCPVAPMRILFTIPHYFHPKGGKHGSLKATDEGRAMALTRQILSLHRLFGLANCMLHIASRTAIPAGQALNNTVDVAVLTTMDRHLLERLAIPSSLYEHLETEAEPLLLGYECHALMRERLGKYDYYCYLEDDLIPVDPFMFVKLAWFTRSVDNGSVLLPHRYELPRQGAFHKVYIDGDLRPDVTRPFQNIRQKPVLKAQSMGQSLVFTRALNPHSGCFFLNAAQMEHFAARPWFLDRSTEFVGPLESAASLGMMRTFKVYKTAPPWAQFLEIEHAEDAFARLIGGEVIISPTLGQKVASSEGQIVH